MAGEGWSISDFGMAYIEWFDGRPPGSADPDDMESFVAGYRAALAASEQRAAAAEAIVEDARAVVLSQWVVSVDSANMAEVMVERDALAGLVQALGYPPDPALAAAPSASSTEGSGVTTRVVTLRCHCGRGVIATPGDPIPWCEGCNQSAATCDCAASLEGE